MNKPPDHDRQGLDPNLSDDELLKLLIPRKRLRWWLLLLVIVITGSIGGTIMVVTRKAPPKQVKKVPPLSATKAPTKVKTAPSPSPKPTQPEYALELNSEPQGATIFSDGNKVGETPVTLKKRYKRLILTKSGYTPSVLSDLGADAPLSRTIELKRLNERTTAAPTSWEMYLFSPSRYRPFTANSSLNLREKWQCRLGARTISSPVVIEDVVFIGGKSALLTAVDLKDGRKKWDIPGGAGTDSTPVIVGKDVFIGSNASSLKAFQREKGKPRGEVILPSYIEASPLLDGEDLYVVTGNGSVHRLKPRKGVFKQVSFEEVWSYEAHERLTGAPLLREDKIYVASVSSLLAIGKNDGKLIRQYKGNNSDDGSSSSGLRIANLDSSTAPSLGLSPQGILYSTGSTLHCVNESAGEAVWTHTCSAAIGTTPIAAAGMVIIGLNDGSLCALDGRSGALVWLTNLGAAIGATPLPINDYLIVGVGSGQLSVIDRNTGETIRSYSLDGALVSSPALIKDTLIVNTINGTLYAFELTAT